MFKKILLPTDGSELSAKAAQGALKLASQLGASVVGLTIVEPYSYSTLSEYRPETLEAFEARNAQAAEQRLASIVQAAKDAGVPCETVTVKSFSPYEAIIETARKHGFRHSGSGVSLIHHLRRVSNPPSDGPATGRCLALRLSGTQMALSRPFQNGARISRLSVLPAALRGKSFMTSTRDTRW